MGSPPQWESVIPAWELGSISGGLSPGDVLSAGTFWEAKAPFSPHRTWFSFFFYFWKYCSSFELLVVVCSLKLGTSEILVLSLILGRSGVGFNRKSGMMGCEGGTGSSEQFPGEESHSQAHPGAWPWTSSPPVDFSMSTALTTMQLLSIPNMGCLCKAHHISVFALEPLEGSIRSSPAFPVWAVVHTWTAALWGGTKGCQIQTNWWFSKHAPDLFYDHGLVLFTSTAAVGEMETWMCSESSFSTFSGQYLDFFSIWRPWSYVWP